MSMDQKRASIMASLGQRISDAGGLKERATTNGQDERGDLLRRIVTVSGGSSMRRYTIFDGEAVTPIVDGVDVDDAYTMWLHEGAPGISPPRHIHKREDEIFHVLEGRVLIECGGQIYEVGPGDVAVLPKGVPHTWLVTSTEPAKMMLTTVPGGIDRLFVQAAHVDPGEEGMSKLSALGQDFGVEVVGPPLEVTNG